MVARRQTPHPSQGAASGVIVMATLGMTAAWFLQGSLSVLAPFLTSDLDLNRTELGVIFFTLSMSGAAVAPLTGRWADRSLGVAFRRLYGFAAAGMLAVAVAPSLVWVLPAMLVGACALGVSNPATNRLIAAGVGPRRRGMALGVKQSGPFIATALAGLVLPSIAIRTGWRWALIAGMAVPVAAWLLSHLTGVRLADAAAPNPSDPGNAVLGSDVWRLAAVGVLVAVGSGVCISFLPLYAKDAVGFSSSTAGLAASVFGVVGVAGRIGWSVAADRRRNPMPFLIGLGFIGSASAVAILVARMAPWSLWLGVTFAGASILSWHAVAWLLLLQSVEQGHIGRASGIVHRANLAGVSVGPPIAGVLIDRTGSYDAAWLLVAILLGTAAVPGGAVACQGHRSPSIRMMWRRFAGGYIFP